MYTSFAWMYKWLKCDDLHSTTSLSNSTTCYLLVSCVKRQSMVWRKHRAMLKWSATITQYQLFLRRPDCHSSVSLSCRNSRFLLCQRMESGMARYKTHLKKINNYMSWTFSWIEFPTNSSNNFKIPKYLN